MEPENTLIRIIEEYGEIDEIDLGNLSYVLGFLGAPMFNDFKMNYLCFDSFELRKTIKKLANDGMIKIKNSNFEIYSLNSNYSNSHEKNDAISNIIQTLKNHVSLYRFALFCKVVEFNPRSGILKLAKKYGISEEESRNYENLIKVLTCANPGGQNPELLLRPVLSSP